jgi:hypothetical protein
MFIYKTTKYDRTTHIHIHVHKEKKNHKTKKKTDMKRITVKSISLCMCHNKKTSFSCLHIIYDYTLICKIAKKETEVMSTLVFFVL